MEYLRTWVRGIAIVSLLAGAAQLVLPSGSMQKYVRLVFGLVITIQVIMPLSAIIGPADATRLTFGDSWSAHLAGSGSFRETYRSQLQWQVENVAKAVPGVTSAKADVELEEVTIGMPRVKRLTVELKSSGKGDLNTGGLREWLGQRFQIREEDIVIRLVK